MALQDRAAISGQSLIGILRFFFSSFRKPLHLGAQLHCAAEGAQNRAQPTPLLSARPVPVLVRCAARALHRLCAVVFVLPVLPQPAKHVLSAAISLLRVNYVILSGFAWRLRSGESVAPRALLLRLHSAGVLLCTRLRLQAIGKTSSLIVFCLTSALTVLHPSSAPSLLSLRTCMQCSDTCVPVAAKLELKSKRKLGHVVFFIMR
jgi:hypothetical protein